MEAEAKCILVLTKHGGHSKDEIKKNNNKIVLIRRYLQLRVQKSFGREY